MNSLTAIAICGAVISGIFAVAGLAIVTWGHISTSTSAVPPEDAPVKDANRRGGRLGRLLNLSGAVRRI